MSGPAFEFEPVRESDFAELLVLRIAAMRESLERIGRFDSQRAAERFRSTFRPADTRRILVDGERAGCVGFWAEGPAAMRVEHFYLDTLFQRRGIGASVLQRLFDEPTAAIECFRVGALRASDANRFYRRAGFVQVSESEFDIEYERPHRRAAA